MSSLRCCRSAPRVLTLLVGLAWSAGAAAQDVESFLAGVTERIGSGDVLRVAGSLQLRGGLNAFASAAGAQRRNAPLTYGATAGLHFDLLGIQAPFTLAYANRNTTYGLPSYTFAGLSPSYRWITLHGGDRSLTFSPYSLSGVTFRGGGFELSPGRWRVAGMRGRLRTERLEDAGADQSGLLLALRRTGQGLQLGYGTDATGVSASVFHSRDRVTATAPLTDTLRRVNAPEANLVVTLAARHAFSPALSAELEYARSALTRDTEAAPLPEASPAQTMLGLHDANVTTSGAGAFKGAIRFAPALATFGLTYERIDPEYRTHGTLYLQDDTENVTASVAVPLLARRLQVSVDGGVQRNDLRGRRASRLRRLIGSAQVQYRWTERVQTSVAVSNLNTVSRLRVLDLSRPTIDSVVLAQTQASLTASTAAMLDAAGERRVVAVVTLQRGRLIRDDEVDPARATSFQLASVTYAEQARGARLGYTLGLVANRSATAVAEVLTVGPQAGLRARLLGEALTADASANLNLRRVAAPTAPDPTTAALLHASLTAAYALTERQSLRLLGRLVRAGDTDALPGYTDTQINLEYGLRF